MSTAYDCKSHNKSQETNCFQFTLKVDGAKELSDELMDALFNAGCDDAIVGMYNDHQLYLEFDREADSLHDALLSAIRAVEGCGRGLTVVAIWPPYSEEFTAFNAALQSRNESIAKLREELAGK